EPGYTLVSLGAYPALLEGGTTSITGEVYEVDDATLAAVDAFEGHPHLYQRTAVRLLGGERVDGYVLVRAHRERPPVIKSGDWRSYQACVSRS
ncbi:MAG: gamma-glutamylcyclotransferase family protein, partial [Polyangiaceae bacterium]